jgi:hypothetical protein
LNDDRRERMRSYVAMLQRPNAGGDVVLEAAGNGGEDMPALSLEYQGGSGILQSKKMKIGIWLKQKKYDPV